MQNCIFCSVVAGKIPSSRIYEDPDYLAFMDVFPRAKGHTLVIPKKHYRWVYDIPQFGAYWEAAKKVASAVQNVTQADYVSFVTMGEEVPHAHIHILPQKNGEQTAAISFGKTIEQSKQEIAELAKRITEKVR
jgi:histidine triad (HIT) family protein